MATATTEQAIPNTPEGRRAFDGWLRSLTGRPITSSHERAMESFDIVGAMRIAIDPPQAALTIDNPTGGGTLVADNASAIDRIILARTQTDPLRPLATIITSPPTDGELPVPTINDISNEGEVIASDSATISEQDLTTGAANLRATFLYNSKILRVSKNLVRQGGAFEQTIPAILGQRLGRKMGRDHSTGQGFNGAHGIVNRAALGVTAASATAIVPNEIWDLWGSVDSEYRQGPSAGLMMNSSVYISLMKSVDGAGAYKFQRPRVDERPSLDGLQVFFNRFMASSITTGEKTVLAGDFSQYVMRDVGPIFLEVLVERYAASNQTAFIASQFHDANLPDGAANAVKYLQQG